MYGARSRPAQSYASKYQENIKHELKDQRLKQWQNEWIRTTKGAITKSFFPKIVDRMKLTINATSSFTTIVTGHGNIETYLHKYKII
jgi:hypothetical protein